MDVHNRNNRLLCERNHHYNGDFWQIWCCICRNAKSCAWWHANLSLFHYRHFGSANSSNNFLDSTQPIHPISCVGTWTPRYCGTYNECISPVYISYVKRRRERKEKINPGAFADILLTGSGVVFTSAGLSWRQCQSDGLSRRSQSDGRDPFHLEYDRGSLPEHDHAQRQERAAAVKERR